MKKLFNVLMILAIAALAFTAIGCDDDESYKSCTIDSSTFITCFEGNVDKDKCADQNGTASASACANKTNACQVEGSEGVVYQSGSIIDEEYCAYVEGTWID